MTLYHIAAKKQTKRRTATNVEEIRERKRNPKSPNPKPERKMGKREKDKTRKRKTQPTPLSLSAKSSDLEWVCRQCRDRVIVLNLN